MHDPTVMLVAPDCPESEGYILATEVTPYPHRFHPRHSLNSRSEPMVLLAL
jgi:hypothetical protein